ncbi:MAG: signal peptide peptidase SppA [Candidatus Dormiibacterota bacterium]
MAYLVFAIRWAAWQVRRPLRRLRRPPAWVVFLVEEAYPEVPPPPRPRWQRLLGGRGTMSLAELRTRFHRIAADPRITGVVLHLRQLDMSQAHVQAFREVIAELRAGGKRVIAYASSYNTATYHLACACDEVLLMRGGGLNAVGYARTYSFLADALHRAGLEADVLQITPYKTAMDFLTRNAMSQQAREMANRLADAAFDELLNDIATGRSIERDAARDLVDRAPLSEEEALELGAIDGVLYEEELDARLEGRMARWDNARRRLARPAPRRPGRYVALLRIEGTILDGRSSSPPAGPRLPVPLLLQSRAGDITVARQARRLADDPRVGAVLLWVDSGGGSSTASEAMTSALSALAAKKPLVAVMGSVAASGGYHVVTAAQRVFAQPTTITGSIGVLAGKVTAGGLFERALVHREPIVRGRHAAMFGIDSPFSDDERARMRRLIEHTYDQFVDRVAEARGQTREAVDAVAGGRVWTGRQALERGLVDELGGVEVALAHARSAAGLPATAPLREARGEGGMGLPTGGGGGLLVYALESAHRLNRASTWLLSPLTC